LPAITQLAKNASGVKNLTIEVADFGLEDRLENTLEIAIFRIIQELVANIIKHSQATEASISLTNHKDVLNIIVEDNGIGFDLSKIRNSSGMGISNIEKRVEHLGGSMEIDTSHKKGTSIIINIPI
ncbi:MAG TPA: ATP-binding protein, partial [Flavobacteriaceae bacterium]|nr:ATP-binding protein [Flavobacteriaceae bacterium]